MSAHTTKEKEQEQILTDTPEKHTVRILRESKGVVEEFRRICNIEETIGFLKEKLTEIYDLPMKKLAVADWKITVEAYCQGKGSEKGLPPHWHRLMEIEIDAFYLRDAIEESMHLTSMGSLQSLLQSIVGMDVPIIDLDNPRTQRND